MTPYELYQQVDYVEGKIINKTSGKKYDFDFFVNDITEKLKWSNKQKQQFRNYFTEYLAPQTEKSKYTENIIEKYGFKFSDGVYFVRGKTITLSDIYRLLWKEEKLLPSDVDDIIENIEKISEPMDLQNNIYNELLSKVRNDKYKKSAYLKSLDYLYPDIDFRSILYNIITPNSKPLFHIFYDDGVGGTGKSTFLEVVTKIVGEQYTSNVLLDQFGNRFIFANMLGKYVNIGDDNGKNDELQNVGTLKSIITGNRITIDRKNISPIEVRIFAKQLFATNILPYIDFTDGGIMRRLNIIPMNKVIPKELKMVKLDEEEISNIVSEVVLHSKDIEINNNNLAITSSPIYRFFNDSSYSIKDYSYYKTFCIDNGFRCMNILNFETKRKFIHEYDKSIKNLKEVDISDIKF